MSTDVQVPIRTEDGTVVRVVASSIIEALWMVPGEVVFPIGDDFFAPQRRRTDPDKEEVPAA